MAESTRAEWAAASSPSKHISTTRVGSPLYGRCSCALLYLIAWLLVIGCGRSLFAAESIPLHAGPLSMVFEPDNAFLRYLKVGSNEVLRGISAPVRNQHWGTVTPQVEITGLDQKPDHFTLTFDVSCQEREVEFLWHGKIEGSANGTVEYTFDGNAQSDFKRNRIGFCVLHGETAAGRPWILETVDNQKTKGAFPQHIAPHQPAKKLKAIEHEFAKNQWARVTFEGDIFEMEDQRNWTDASFKTYCTPLEIPYPVQLRKGDKVWQRITLSLSGELDTQQPASSSTPIVLTARDEASPLPGIGLQLSSQSEELSTTEIGRLKLLHLDHLRVDLTSDDKATSHRWKQAAQQANALNVPLIAALHLDGDPAAAIERVLAACQSADASVSVFLVIGSNHSAFEQTRTALQPYFPHATFGVGQDTNFTELNRNRPSLENVSAVAFGMNPQVHAFDNASMVETLPIEGDTVRSARQFLGSLPIVVSPVTLRVQQLKQQPLPGELPANVDARQATAFAAAWTLGSLKYLAEAHVSRVTYYETVGWKGLMASASEKVSHPKFPAAPGQVFPVYHLLANVGEFAKGQVHRTDSSQPMSVVGLSLSLNNRRRLLIANLSSLPQSVSLRGFTKSGMLTFLPNANAQPYDVKSPLVLTPYAVARIDVHAD